MILALFLNSFCYVGLKVWQQKNVIGNHYAWMVPTSYLMAAGEVYGVSVVSRGGFQWQIVAAIGTGAWIGAFCAMALYKRLNRRKNRAA